MNTIEHIKLKNGANIYYYANPLYTTSTAMIKMDAGSYMEDKGVNGGWSHLMEHMIFKSSELWNVNDRLDKFCVNGVEWNGYTSHDEVHFYITCPNRFYEKSFDMFLDMIFHPLFDRKELKTERDVVIAEFKENGDKDFQKCYRLFIEKGFSKESRNTFFTNNPYGTISDLKKCNPDSLREFYNRYIDSRNLTFIMVGPPRDYDKFIKKIEKLNLKTNKYNIISKCKERIKKAQEYKIRCGYSIYTKDKRDSTLIHVWRNAPSVKDFKDNDLLQSISYAYQELMGGRPNSILWNNLREQKGYTYGINMYKDVSPFCSYQFVVSEVNNSKIKPFIKDLFGVIDYFSENGVDDKNFNRLIKSLKNDYYFDKNKSLLMADKIRNDLVLGIKPKTLKEKNKLYDSITKDDINIYHKFFWSGHKSYVSAITKNDKYKELRDALCENDVVIK